MHSLSAAAAAAVCSAAATICPAIASTIAEAKVVLDAICEEAEAEKAWRLSKQLLAEDVIVEKEEEEDDDDDATSHDAYPVSESPTGARPPSPPTSARRSRPAEPGNEPSSVVAVAGLPDATLQRLTASARRSRPTETLV